MKQGAASKPLDEPQLLLRALAAAQREADHYRTSVEMAQHISWSADESGAIRTVSARWTEVTGIAVAKALDSGWLDALHPDDVEPTMCAWRVALETASSVDVDYRLRTSSGYRWFRSCASPRLNDNGLAVAWFGTLEDIDDRKRVETELLASEERFRLAAEAAGLGIWDYDALRGSRLWSDVFRAMLGLAPEVPAEPATALALVVSEDRPLLRQLVDSISDGDTNPRFELTVRINRADDGALRWMQTSGWRVKSANGRIERVLVTVRDVTEQLTAERRIRWAAEHDPLTGLVNRAAFNRLLEDAIARADQSDATMLTLALFDVDHFKDTNDTVGHDAGDLLLRTVAERLVFVLGDDVVVARLGSGPIDVSVAIRFRLREETGMSDLFWLTDEQIERLRPFFLKSHGRPRVDDRRVLSGIVFVNRNGLRWRDAPSAYGPHKTLYNRWKRWGERGVFTRMLEGLAAGDAEPKTVMIDATYLKAHRTASSLRVKRGISAA